MLVGGISVQMLIDSGSSTNVIDNMDKGTWEELNSQRMECETRGCEKKLYA